MYLKFKSFTVWRVKLTGNVQWNFQSFRDIFFLINSPEHSELPAVVFQKFRGNNKLKFRINMKYFWKILILALSLIGKRLFSNI